MEALNFPKVPEMIHDTTGGAYNFNELRDNFFQSVVDFVGFNTRAQRWFTEIKHQTPIDVDKVEDRTAIPLDVFSYLIMREYPVASTWEWRTPGNYRELRFHLYLTEKLLVKLREEPILLTDEVRKQLENA